MAEKDLLDSVITAFSRSFQGFTGLDLTPQALQARRDVEDFFSNRADAFSQNLPRLEKAAIDAESKAIDSNYIPELINNFRRGTQVIKNEGIDDAIKYFTPENINRAIADSGQRVAGTAIKLLSNIPGLDMIPFSQEGRDNLETLFRGERDVRPEVLERRKQRASVENAVSTATQESSPTSIEKNPTIVDAAAILEAAGSDTPYFKVTGDQEVKNTKGNFSKLKTEPKKNIQQQAEAERFRAGARDAMLRSFGQALENGTIRNGIAGYIDAVKTIEDENFFDQLTTQEKAELAEIEKKLQGEADESGISGGELGAGLVGLAAILYAVKKGKFKGAGQKIVNALGGKDSPIVKKTAKIFGRKDFQKTMGIKQKASKAFTLVDDASGEATKNAEKVFIDSLKSNFKSVKASNAADRAASEARRMAEKRAREYIPAIRGNTLPQKVLKQLPFLQNE